MNYRGVHLIPGRSNVNDEAFWSNREESEISRGTSASEVIFFSLLELFGLDKNGKNKEVKLIDLGSGKFNKKSISVVCEMYLNFDSFALDISEKFARSFGESNVKSVFSKIEETPFSDDFFDITVSSHSIEHTANIERSLAEISRITKKNGVIVMNVPIGEGWTNDLDHNYWFSEDIDFAFGDIIEFYKGNQKNSLVQIYRNQK